MFLLHLALTGLPVEVWGGVEREEHGRLFAFASCRSLFSLDAWVFVNENRKGEALLL